MGNKVSSTENFSKLSKARKSMIAGTVTKEEKENILSYCRRHGLSITDFLRTAISNYNSKLLKKS